MTAQRILFLGKVNVFQGEAGVELTKHHKDYIIYNKTKKTHDILVLEDLYAKLVMIAEAAMSSNIGSSPPHQDGNGTSGEVRSRVSPEISGPM